MYEKGVKEYMKPGKKATAIILILSHQGRKDSEISIRSASIY